MRPADICERVADLLRSSGETLIRAAKDDPVAAAMDKALKDLRRLKEKVGGRNKLAKVLGVTGPYIGRILKGEKPMTEELVERLTIL